MPRKKLKSKWLRLETSNGIVYCSELNLKNLKKKLKTNKIEVLNEYFIDRFDIDLPGPILQDRLWEDFKLDGVLIGIPLHCLNDVIMNLKLAQKHDFNSKKHYYALHYTFNFVIFSTEERQSFLDLLETLPKELFNLAEQENNKLDAALTMFNHTLDNTKDFLPN